MYYTGQGDKGTSTIFNSSERLTKSDPIFELLGSLDELNSWLGFCAVEAESQLEIQKIIQETQNNLFICQAFFAQAKVIIPTNLLSQTEIEINRISQLIKPRNSFVLSGGSRLSALLDVGRTLARKVERRAVALDKKSSRELNELILSYLNRLSSLLYVLARLANDVYKVTEKSPDY